MIISVQGWIFEHGEVFGPPMNDLQTILAIFADFMLQLCKIPLEQIVEHFI